jgi:hypothetical protein
VTVEEEEETPGHQDQDRLKVKKRQPDHEDREQLLMKKLPGHQDQEQQMCYTYWRNVQQYSLS